MLRLAALVACGTRTGLDVEHADDASSPMDATTARDASVRDAPIALGNGCADGTREAFADGTRYPRIAACAGACTGYIDGASALALCSSDGTCAAALTWLFAR